MGCQPVLLEHNPQSSNNVRRLSSPFSAFIPKHLYFIRYQVFAHTSEAYEVVLRLIKHIFTQNLNLLIN